MIDPVLESMRNKASLNSWERTGDADQQAQDQRDPVLLAMRQSQSQSQTQNLAIGAAHSQQFGPDQYATARKQESATGLSADVAARNPDEASRRMLSAQLDDTVRQDPRLAEWLGARPERVTLVKDELAPLRTFGQFLQKVGQYTIGTNNDFVDRMDTRLGASFAKTMAQANYTFSDTLAQMAGGDEQVKEDLYRMKQDKAQLDAGGHTYIGQLVQTNIQFQEDMLAVRENARGVSREAAATTAQMSKGLTRADPEYYIGMGVDNLPLMMGSMLAGGPIAGAAVAGVGTYFQTYMDSREQGFDFQTSSANATVQASIEALFSHFGLGKAFGSTATIGKRFLSTLGRESLGEGATQIAQSVTDALYTGKHLDLGELAGETFDAMVVGGLMAGPEAILGTRAMTDTEREAANKAAQQRAADILASVSGAAQLTTLHRIAANLKLGERAPDEQRDMIKHLVGQGAPPTVFINANEFKALFQSEAPSLATELTGDADALPLALASGGDIAIPMEQYLTRLAKSPKAAELEQHARLDQKHLSVAELAQVNSAEFLKQMHGDMAGFKATAETQAEDNSIHDEVKAQLIAAGVKPGDAKSYATLYGSVFRTLAHRSNGRFTAREVWDRYKLKIGSTPQQAMLGAGNAGPGGEWVAPSPEVAKAVGDLMAKRATLEVGSPERKVVEEHIANLVSERGNAFMQGLDFDQASAQPDAAAFDAASFRPEVVTWAKKTFGDLVAPNGNPAWQNFTAWFGDSKVVDANGNPRVVFHGTASVDGDILHKFDESKRGASTHADSAKKAFFFTASAREAEGFGGLAARRGDKPGGVALVPTYLSLQNPMIVDMGRGSRKDVEEERSFSEIIDAAKAAGHDGVIFKNAQDSTAQTVVTVGGKTFSPDNNGMFMSDTLPAWLAGGPDKPTREDVQKELDDAAAWFLTAYEPGGDYEGEEFDQDAADMADMWKEMAAAWREDPSKFGMRRGEGPTDVFAVFNSGDIKSVSNTGQFDRSNPNILFQSMSTRVPTAKKASENPLQELLMVGLDSAKADPVSFAKNIALLKTYPNVVVPEGATDDEVAEIFIKHVTENLLWLHDQVPEETRIRSKLWYDGANRIARAWIQRYGISEMQASAALAVLSPQKDWFQNVSLAERVLDVMSQQQGTAWDDAMTETAARIFAKPQYADMVAKATGKPLSAMETDLERALWVRAYDEAHHVRSYRVVTPEGEFAGHALTGKAEPQKVAWGSLGEIAKAVSVFRDPSIQNVSDRLGGQHKVRNFYNNIFDPGSKRPFVTIDTHAVAAGLLRPLAGADREVAHNFGSGVTGETGSASSALTGSQGTYGLYAEAYARAAAERGILAREMQSITWEAVRGLFPAKFKTAANASKIDAIWERFKAGEIDVQQARDEVRTLAGGITAPEWERSGGRASPSEGTSSYAGGVDGALVPGGTAQAVDSGNGAVGSGTAANGNPVQPSQAQADGAVGGELFQNESDKPRGSFIPGANIISLFQETATTSKFDRSTFLHESAHFFLEVMGDLAQTSPEIATMYADALKWMGTDEATWRGMTLEQKTPGHEQFARGFEAYLREGKAPSKELRNVFRQFKAWMIQVYRQAKQLRVTLNPEIRSVFDRLVATDDAINAAIKEQAFQSLGDAKALGLTPEQMASYEELVRDVADDAKEEVLARLMKQEDRKKRKWWKAELKSITKTVADEANAMPLYRTLSALRTGKEPDGTPMDQGKLSKAALLEMLPDPDMLIGLTGLYQTEGGMHPDFAAALFGFTSGKEMLAALVDATPRREFIAAEAEKRMAAKFPDGMNDGTLSEEAMAAIHNSKRVKVAEREMQAVADLAGQPAIPMRVLQAIADAEIARKTVAGVLPHRYLQAMKKAAAAARKATAAGNYAEAFIALRTEALNLALYRAATKASRNIAKAERFSKRLAKKPAQKRIAGAKMGFIDHINAMLDVYGFRDRDADEIARQPGKLGDFIDSLQDADELTNVSDGVVAKVEAGQRVNWKSLTVGEVAEYLEAMQNLSALASRQNHLTAGSRRIDLDAAVAEMVGRTATAPGLRKAKARVSRRDITQFDTITDNITGFFNAMTRIEFQLEALDGGDTGPWHDFFWEPLLRGHEKMITMRARIQASLSALHAAMPENWEAMLREQVTFKDVGMSRASLIGIAMNAFNDGNLQRLKDGGFAYGDQIIHLTEQDVNEALGLLTEAELHYVQGLLDAVDLKAEIVDLSQRVGAVVPKLVHGTARTVVSSDGVAVQMRGGYWPILFDGDKSDVGARAADNDTNQSLAAAGSARAVTPQGRLKSRADEVHDKPLDFDYAHVLALSLQQVMTDIAFREAVRDTNMLLAHPKIRTTIADKLGPGAMGGFKGAVSGSIGARSLAELSAGPFHRALDYVLSNSAFAALAIHVGLAIANYGGALAQAMTRTQGRYLSAAFRDIWAERRAGDDPDSVHNTLLRLSPEMANELRDTDYYWQQQIGQLNGKKGYEAAYKRFGMTVFRWVNNDITRVVWIARYRQEMASGKVLQSQAIRLADKAVRTSQQSRLGRDKSTVERDVAFKGFMQFMGPMFPIFGTLKNAYQGRGVTKTGSERVAAMTYMWIIAPAIFLLLNGRAPDDDDDGDGTSADEWAWWAAREIGAFPLQTIPLARDIQPIIDTITDKRQVNVRSSPLASMVQNAIWATKDLNKMLHDEKDNDWEDYTSDLGSLSGVIGGPAGAIKRMSNFSKAVLDDKPDTASDLFQIFMYGRVKYPTKDQQP